MRGVADVSLEMPKLYEYLGIVVRFFSEEHEPVHIHAFYGEYQLKVELIIKSGKIVTIKYKNVI